MLHTRDGRGPWRHSILTPARGAKTPAPPGSGRLSAVGARLTALWRGLRGRGRKRPAA